jgi:hypothetical protein
MKRHDLTLLHPLSTFNRFPYHRVHLQLVGLLCGFLGIFGSAFATEPWHILLTLGLIYPVVCCAFPSPFRDVGQ